MMATMRASMCSARPVATFASCGVFRQQSRSLIIASLLSRRVDHIGRPAAESGRDHGDGSDLLPHGRRRVGLAPSSDAVGIRCRTSWRRRSRGSRTGGARSASGPRCPAMSEDCSPPIGAGSIALLGMFCCPIRTLINERTNGRRDDAARMVRPWARRLYDLLDRLLAMIDLMSRVFLNGAVQEIPASLRPARFHCSDDST